MFFLCHIFEAYNNTRQFFIACSGFEEKLPAKHVNQGKTEEKRWRGSRRWKLLDGFMENRR